MILSVRNEILWWQIEAKNKFKASGYVADLAIKDKQLLEARLKVVDQEEEMRKLSMMKTKLDGERALILTDMKKMEAEIREMRATYEG